MYGTLPPAFAQSAGEWTKEEHIYHCLLNGQGDSIYAALNEEAQRQLSSAMFNDSFRQLETQFGPFQQADVWKRDYIQGMEFSYRDMRFERYTLRLLLGFGADGKLHTLRLAPAPDPATATAATFDKERMVERDIEVVTGCFRMPGTLTLPLQAVEAGRRVPCVVMVHGSGPNDRDESVGPNKPFRDLAWRLARHGVASIRYDKRTKVYGAACVPPDRQLDMDVETCDDALSAIRLARTLPEVAPDSVFVLGHSQGGMMAPRIAKRTKSEVAGIVVVAGLARPMEDALLEQAEYLASLSGQPHSPQLDGLKKQVENVKQLGTSGFCDTIPLPLGLPLSYWKYLKDYHQQQEMSALSCPVLVLQGERDYQVTMQDYGLWLMALLGNPRAQLKSYPDLNHILQEGKGKSTPMEYGEARPVPTYVAEDVAGFIRGKDIRR